MVESGDIDGATEAAARLATQIPPENTTDLLQVRAAAARLAALKGPDPGTGDDLDLLEVAASSIDSVDFAVAGLASSASARHARGESDRAAELLAAAHAAATGTYCVTYPSRLPGLVRIALALRLPDLALRLVTGVEPVNPYAGHALVAANAALAESRGDAAAAAEGYAEAAHRWHDFGVIPEEGFALLGQGRCLIHLGQRAEAVPVLNAAHAVFERLGATPALQENDHLLESARRANT